MMNGFGWWRVALTATAWLVLPASAAAQMTCDPCTVGLVLDGPWERNDEIRAIFEREIVALVEPAFDVVFPAEKRRLADWTLDGTRDAVEALLADDEVDLLMTSGPVASNYVGHRDDLPKPVIAAFVLDPEVQRMPLEVSAAGERVSGEPNLSYVTFPGNFPAEVSRFREVVPFRHLTFIGNDSLLTTIPDLEQNLRDLVVDLDLELEIVRVGTSVDAVLAAIPPGTEAVYVTPLIQLPPGDFDRLVREFNRRRLPTFSSWGRSDVDRGALMSIYLDTDFQRLGRRIAVNLQRVLLGEDGGAIPVDFRRSQRLTINMATARAIGVYPSWSVMTEAELRQDERLNIGRRLDLPTAASAAVAANLDLLATDRFVDAGAEEVRVARAALRPQAFVSSGVSLIDRDRAAASFGGQPQRQYRGTLGVSQLLYSDGARAQATIARHRQTSRELQREETRLDIVLAAAVSYLTVLTTKTFERIQRENLGVTRSNLELAQSRQQIGVARAAEVIRWEHEIANNRRDVIEAGAQRNIAEIDLNRLLNRPLEEPFFTADADVADRSLTTSAPFLQPYVGNPFAFDIFRDFMTQEGLARSPEVQQLHAAIRATERATVAARRAFWAPTVVAEGDVTGLEGGGAGSSGASLDLPFELTRPDGLNWTVGVSASLSLFEGGARRAERARAETELAQLRLDLRAARERVEQRVRSSLHLAGSSFAGIELADDASNAAGRNLSLVTDAYEQGAASILDLLDAQNASLVAELVAANAVHDYLIDLMDVQRAIGRFDFFTTPDAARAFRERLEAFFAAAGFDPRGRSEP